MFIPKKDSVLLKGDVVVTTRDIGVKDGTLTKGSFVAVQYVNDDGSCVVWDEDSNRMFTVWRGDIQPCSSRKTTPVTEKQSFIYYAMRDGKILAYFLDFDDALDYFEARDGGVSVYAASVGAESAPVLMPIQTIG